MVGGVAYPKTIAFALGTKRSIVDDTRWNYDVRGRVLSGRKAISNTGTFTTSFGYDNAAGIASKMGMYW